ncbi:MAG: TonB-dependent receptor, partial [Pseudomonadota bacterium]
QRALADAEKLAEVEGLQHVGEGALFGIGVTYQDESFITNGPNSDGVRPVLPSYARVDAAAYYDISDTLRVQVNIENLTDTLYFPNAHSTHQATVGAPLNARFTVSGRF